MLTCKDKIADEFKNREQEIQELISNPDADWTTDSPALSIEKEEVITICLSWGGPADYLEVWLKDGEVTKMQYRYSDWFDTATMPVDESSPLYKYALYELQMLDF